MHDACARCEVPRAADNAVVEAHTHANNQVGVLHGEIGLDVIASVGAQRFGEHRSVPEIHRGLQARQLRVCQRSVTNLIQRYEELVSLQLLDRPRVNERLGAQGRVVLAIDGLQPDVGNEILWVIREEAYYFAPQAQTKIMNEGWATYWHAKIMTERALNDRHGTGQSALDKSGRATSLNRILRSTNWTSAMGAPGIEPGTSRV